MELVEVYATVPIAVFPAGNVELDLSGPVPAINSVGSSFDNVSSPVFAMCMLPSLSKTIAVGALKVADVPFSINAL